MVHILYIISILLMCGNVFYLLKVNSKLREQVTHLTHTKMRLTIERNKALDELHKLSTQIIVKGATQNETRN